MFPSIVFVYRRLRARKLLWTDAVLLALLAWTMLQCAATAYGRGAGGGPNILASRYLDLLTVNLVLGFIFAVREFVGTTRMVIAAIWSVAVISGVVQQSLYQWQGAIVPNIARDNRREVNVRSFLATGDTACLRNKPFGDIPYPSADALLERLKSPAIQNVMPSSVRRPVSILVGTPHTPQELPQTLALPPWPIAMSTWSLRSTAGTFQWRSAEQPDSTLPVLRFRVAGDLGNPACRIRLVVRNAASEVSVAPESSPGEHWKTVNVFRPPGKWWMEATGTGDGAWFAFSGPIEVGRWSWFVEKLLKHHFAVIATGVALLITSTFILIRLPNNNRRISPSQ